MMTQTKAFAVNRSFAVLRNRKAALVLVVLVAMLSGSAPDSSSVLPRRG